MEMSGDAWGPLVKEMERKAELAEEKLADYCDFDRDTCLASLEEALLADTPESSTSIMKVLHLERLFLNCRDWLGPTCRQLRKSNVIQGLRLLEIGVGNREERLNYLDEV